MVQAYYNVRHETVEINSTADPFQLHDSNGASDELDMFSFEVRVEYRNALSCLQELLL